MDALVVYVDIDQGICGYKSKVAQNWLKMKYKKNYLGFLNSYSKNMANFEAFHQTISSSI